MTIADWRRMSAVLAIALSIRCLLLEPSFSPDSWRFIEQAQGLRYGRGFLWEGRPTTSFPPGYPVFLAALGWFSTDPAIVVLINLVLSSLACAAVYAALCVWAPVAAFPCAVVLALNPWLASQAGAVLSEPLSTCLCGALLATLARLRSSVAAFLVGALVIALPLTAPATGIMALGLGLVALWQLRERRRTLAIFVAGSLLVLLPWEVHCQRVTGRPQLLVPTLAWPSDGQSAWVRTWWTDQLYDTPGWTLEFERMPREAFKSSEQFHTFIAAREDPSPGSVERMDALLATTARARVRDDSLRYVIMPALRRALSLWTSMPPVWHVDRDWALRASRESLSRDLRTVGVRRAVFRLAKSFSSAVAGFTYVVHSVLLFGGLLWAVRSGNRYSGAVLVGVVVYTAISALTALGESRRNLPFYPALYCVLCLPAKKR